MPGGAVRLLAALALAALIVPVLGASGSRETRSETRHVRATDSRLERALDDGLVRSATLRSLVERLDQSDVIVHIMPQVPSSARTGGEIRFVVSSGGARYLRITIKQDLPWPTLVAMIGHELQHALEVADAPRVVDNESLKHYYARIGFSPETGFHETEEAKRVGQRVLREFRAGPR